MNKVAIYARVSSDAQAERQTIESQLHACRKWAAANDTEVSEVYADDGVSGMIPFEQRPAGAQLLASGTRAVVIYSADRLARDAYEGARAMRDLERAGIAVHFVVLAFEDSPEGRLMFNLMLGIAQWDRENFLRKSKLGKQRALREGRWHGSRRPYGYQYDTDTRKLALDPAQADVLRSIANHCDAGQSVETIADVLNADAIPGPDGKGWHGATIAKMLKRDYYSTGLLAGTYMGESYELGVPPILDAELQARVIRRLATNRHFPVRRDTYALFQGRIACGACERRFKRGLSGTPATRKEVYRCAGRDTRRARHDGTERCTHSPILPMVETDAKLWTAFLVALSDPKPLAERFLHTVESETVALKAGIGGYSELAELKAKRNWAIDQLAKPGVSLESTQRVVDSLNAQIERLERRLDAQDAEVRRYEFLSAQKSTLETAVATDTRVILRVEPRTADGLRPRELREWLATERKVLVTFRDGVEPPVDFRSIPGPQRAFNLATRIYSTTADRLLDWLGVKVVVSHDGTLRLNGTAIYAVAQADKELVGLTFQR